MAIINDSEQPEVLNGTPTSDTINGFGGDDLINGGAEALAVRLRAIRQS
ncbi:hypothetical protein [Sinorhizobium meliloti]|nr:hypothetical protein [Sinorhizobium meliloti]